MLPDLEDIAEEIAELAGDAVAGPIGGEIAKTVVAAATEAATERVEANVPETKTKRGRPKKESVEKTVKVRAGKKNAWHSKGKIAPGEVADISAADAKALSELGHVTIVT